VTRVDADAYCREVEAHLCRRNAGHLVRVVGPAFEMVAGWAAQGIPLRVALRGIDTCVDRRSAKGPGRRPLRVEFCEADVLDAFDQWRRAVGIGTAGGGAASAELAGEEPGAEGRSRPGHSLRAHLDRVVTRLTDRVAGGALPDILEAAIEAVIDELEPEREVSRTLRGEARGRLIARLMEVDERLMAAARAATPADRLAETERDAMNDLQAFAGRMPPDAYARAVEAASAKRLREFWKLPDVSYES
jgi:hypothetical protein